MTDPFQPAQLPWSPDTVALPHSVEAEREVLSAVFIDPAALGQIAELLTAADFYVERHGLIYEAMLSAHGRDGTVDFVILRQEMKDRGVWEQSGGDVALGALMDRAGTTSNLELYCRTVQEKAFLRRLIGAAQWIQAECHQPVDDLEVLIGQAEERLRQAGRGCHRGQAMTAEQVIDAALERAYRAKEGDLSATGLETGWRDVDALIGAIPAGLTIVAGATKHAKSSWALQLATRIAGRGHGVVEWHGEMRDFQVGGRRIGTTGRLDTKRFMEARDADRDSWDRAHRAAEKLRGLPIMADFEPGLTANQVCTRFDSCLRELEKAGVKGRLTVVDHFDKLRHGDDLRRQEHEHQARSCATFANWAKVRGLSLLLLAQPTKAGRQSGTPESSWIKGTGAVSEEAELVLWVRRPCKLNPQVPEDEFEVHVVEQRQGPLGLARLLFHPQQMRFYDR
jgi:replicative DNA helicase